MVTRQASTQPPHWLHHTCDRAAPAGNAATTECYQHRHKCSWCPEPTPASNTQQAQPGTHHAVVARKHHECGNSACRQWGLSAGNVLQACNNATTWQRCAKHASSQEGLWCCSSKHTTGRASMPAALGGGGPCAERNHAGLSAGQAHIGCVDPLSAGASVLVNICSQQHRPPNNTDKCHTTLLLSAIIRGTNTNPCLPAP